jgi:methyl-accepting chemotaxis protein
MIVSMKKIVILILVVALAFECLAVWAVFENNTIEKKAVIDNEYSGAYTEFVNLLALTQEMRRREKDFFLRKDVIYAKQYENLSGEALDHLQHLRQFEIEKTSDLDRLAALLQSHKKEFLFSVSVQDEIGFNWDKGIQGRMRDNIHALEDLLVYKIKNDKLTLMLFTMRRNEKNFLLNMASSPDLPTPEVAQEFEDHLKKLPIQQETKAQATELLNKYLVDFKTLVTKEETLTKSVASLTSIFTEFERIHYALLKDARAQSKDAYENMMGTIRLSRNLSYGLVLLASVLVLVLCLYGWRNRRISI